MFIDKNSNLILVAACFFASFAKTFESEIWPEIYTISYFNVFVNV